MKLKKIMAAVFAVITIALFPAQQRILVYSDHEPYGNMRTKFLKEVFFSEIEKQSCGRLKIEPHWSSEISTGYDALGAITAKKKADMAVVVPEYVAKDMPLHQLFKSFPMGPSGQQQVNFVQSVFKKVPTLSTELSNNYIVNLFTATGYPVGFFSMKKLENLDGIKGQSWRSASFWHHDFLRNSGATPVSMPWNDGIFKAMNEGKLNGLMVNTDGAYDLKVHEIATNALVSKDLWMGHIYLIAINKDVYNTIPARDKAAIKRAARISASKLGAVMDRSFTEQNEKIKEKGADLRVLSRDEVAAWAKNTDYQNVQDKWAAEQEQKGVKSVKLTLEKMRRLLKKYL